MSADRPEIVTERLRLRTVTIEDAESLLAIYGDAEVMELYPKEPCRTVADCRSVIWRMLDGERKELGFRWAIVDQLTGEVIGSLGFHAWDRMASSAYLSWELVPPYRGRGLAQEAARAIISYGFETLGLEAILAEVHPSNAPSITLARRLGFAPAGVSNRVLPTGDRLSFRLFELRCGLAAN